MAAAADLDPLEYAKLPDWIAGPAGARCQIIEIGFAVQNQNAVRSRNQETKNIQPFELNTCCDC